MPMTSHRTTPDDLNFTWPRPDRSPATVAVPSTRQEVHLLIRYTADFSTADEVVAALTTRGQAEALLETYERLEAAPSGYDLVAVPLHANAAAALGL